MVEKALERLERLESFGKIGKLSYGRENFTVNNFDNCLSTLS